MNPTTSSPQPAAERLRQLNAAGQSAWLDYIRRGHARGGELGRLVAEDGLRGVTSNPSIFEKAIAGSNDYRRPRRARRRRCDERTRADLRGARRRGHGRRRDVLRRSSTRPRRRDGYVSLEVAPDLARDTEGTVAEARRLWPRSIAPTS